MRYLKTNTATRVTVGPFLDKTDGITPEVALTVTSEKLTFVVDDAGVPTLVLDVAPTASGGANDMVHITGDDAGYYDLELAAANVNYLGRAVLSLNDVATHLPVFHEFMILSAQAYDSLFGTGNLSADVKAITAGVDFSATQKASINTEVDSALNTAIPGSPTADSINQRVAAIDDLTQASGGGDLAAILTDTGTTLQGELDAIEVAVITNAAGADIAADIIALKAETVEILTDTAVIGALGAGLTALATQASVNTIDGIVDDILVDTAVIGALGAGLTGIPWNAAWDAEVQSEVFDALDAAFTDATGLTANGLLERIRTLGWILRNKIAVTDANGNTVIYKDDSTTAGFTVNAMLTDDSTTTTRLRAA